MAALKQDEAALWNKGLRPYTPMAINAHRIEARNPPGISDVYWTKYNHMQGGTSGWIELKSNVTEIRKEQRIFLQSLRRHGIPAVILAEYGPTLYLIDPMQVDLSLKLDFSEQSEQVLCRLWPTKTNGQEIWGEVWKRILRGR